MSSIFRGALALESHSNVHTRVKVCGIRSHDEARSAVLAGVSAVGLILEGDAPDPCALSLERICSIAQAVPPGVECFLVSSATSADDLANQLDASGCTALQVASLLPLDELRRLHVMVGSPRVDQTLYVEGTATIDVAKSLEGHVDALTLDTPSQTGPSFGGTGRTHDWAISAMIRGSVGIPIFLAGGLHPGNVAEAIRIVRPFAVDVSSGVRDRRHQLDLTALNNFMANIWQPL